MNEFELYFDISSLFNFIAQITLFIVSLLYWLRSKSIASVLMVIGSLFLVVSMITWTIVLSVFSSSSDPQNLVAFQAISAMITSLFAIIFAIGFAMNLLNRKKTT